MKTLKSISKVLAIVITILCINLNLHAQTQKGTDINGEAAGDNSGGSVSMPDANTVAIGAPSNSGNGSYAGHVRIYAWNGNAWTQKGSDINGEAAGDNSGSSVNMPDANTLAIGAPYNSGNGTAAGHVRIYSWNGTDWLQKGSDIDGEDIDDWFGYSVCMPDANTLAIGAIYDLAAGSDFGYVKIFTWNGNSWVQKGLNIVGESDGDMAGYSVSMPDANTVAIGAPDNDGSGIDAGSVRIYTWTGTAWLQKGSDIDGEAADDYSGCSVSMPDINTVAIGALYNSGNGTIAGHVRIYVWTGTTWLQKGIDIEGEAADDLSGSSVSMPDANTVAIGAPYNSGNGTMSGHVRIYTWTGTIWQQNGIDIEGEAADDYSGCSVSMPDANTVAIGAPVNDGNGIDAGHVRIYSINNVGIQQNDFGQKLHIFPNPTDGNIVIDLGRQYEGIVVTAKNELGQEVCKKENKNTCQLQITIPGKPGIYFIKISAENKKALLKVIKK